MRIFYYNQNIINNTYKGGYVALISILIMSFILLSVSITVGFEGFWNLKGMMDREMKEISFNLAQTCLDQAIVRVVQSPSWQPDIMGENLAIGEYTCIISKVERSNQLLSIETQAQVGDSFTSLKSIFDEKNFKIISIEEL